MDVQEEKGTKCLHIGLYGRSGSGKTSLVKALTGQNPSMLTIMRKTDVQRIYRPLDIKDLGKVVFSEISGPDEIWKHSKPGDKPVEQADIVGEPDMALVLFREADMHGELIFYRHFKSMGKPVIPIISRADTLGDDGRVLARLLEQKIGQKPLCVSAMKGAGLKELREAIVKQLSEVFGGYALAEDQVGEGDMVLLVMPKSLRLASDKLILPQVKILCELLVRKCPVMSCTLDSMKATLEMLPEAPKLIITDLESLDEVRSCKPDSSMLTTFSVLCED